MGRPLGAREALRFSPLVKAGWADASSVEGVPIVSACAEPFIFFSGRPATDRAADARGFGLAGFLIFLKLAVWSNGGSIGRWTHLFGSLNPAQRSHGSDPA
jgi:hypothetical protein